VQRLYDQAVDKMHEGSFFQASRLLEQAVTDDPAFSLGHARLAEANAELDYSEKALTSLLRVGDLNALPEYERLRVQAVQHAVNRDFAKAAGDYRLLLEMTAPDEKQHALVDLGRALEKNESSLTRQ